MKKTLAIAAIALFALAGAVGQQRLTTFTNSTKSLQLTFREFSMVRTDKSTYHFVLTNPGGVVHAISEKQHIEFMAPRMQVDAISVFGKDNEANAIRNATASGGIRAIRTGNGGRAEMTGSTAKYSADGAKASLRIGGPVKLTNTGTGGHGFTATGSSLVADLGPSRTFETATLNGPVRLQIRQAEQSGQPGLDLVVAASKLLLDETSKPTTITLSGGVHINGVGSGMTAESTLSRLVLRLDDQGEVVYMSGTADQR
ncbi:MAG TPA: hypothetical protein VHE55_05055 [Fimbriimonadaceae bacterium]|nr:hypothetical protein [Fimbriimonadaceae bacterium]